MLTNRTLRIAKSVWGDFFYNQLLIIKKKVVF